MKTKLAFRDFSERSYGHVGSTMAVSTTSARRFIANARRLLEAHGIKYRGTFRCRLRCNSAGQFIDGLISDGNKTVIYVAMVDQQYALSDFCDWTFFNVDLVRIYHALRDGRIDRLFAKRTLPKIPGLTATDII